LKRPTAESERRLDELRERASQQQQQQQQQQAPSKLSYHDLPLLKPPVWTWEIPTYFFVGGAAGACAVLGFAAQLGGNNPRLVRDARRIAAIGAALSAPLLIADLGRPERFLNMLRVFKVRSPMSVGAWTVAVFGGAATVAALTDSKLAGAASAATGLVMATYTGVLLGVTAIPVWSQNARLLPVHFGASALGSGVALLELRGHDDAALNALGIGAATFETAAGSALHKLADVLSGPVPLALRVLGGGKRTRQAAAVSTLLGSLITRFAWVEAGKASARRANPA
jgi:formate-dependent nitrite reductase membrane component NrfD